jgi:hypothetical protein
MVFLRLPPFCPPASTGCVAQAKPNKAFVSFYHGGVLSMESKAPQLGRMEMLFAQSARMGIEPKPMSAQFLHPNLPASSEHPAFGEFRFPSPSLDEAAVGTVDPTDPVRVMNANATKLVRQVAGKSRDSG